MQPNFAVSALYALDNLDVMRGMDSETVHLIYADPPFNSKRIYQGMAGTRAAGHRFGDTWSWNDAKEEWLDQFANDWPVIADLLRVARVHSDGMAGYLAFMAVRVIEMHRVLRPEGSLYLHCDPTASSYLRNLLDVVFGARLFRNEISWKRYRGRRSPKQPKAFPKVVDLILLYAKSDSSHFDLPFSELDEAYVKRTYRHDDNDGKGPYRYGGRIRDRKYYLSNSRGTPVTTWWDDINELNGTASESTGWQTQKPLALLERIIKASSNEGDIVFDPFCGCGTALVAAEQLGRQWVGADDDANAVDVIRARIANLTGAVTDAPQMQHGVSVLTDPPERTATATETIYKDPTGYIVPKMPSDRMSNEAIRQQLIKWQEEQDGLITCPGCAERLKPRHFHCDHINPKSAGGINRIDNRIMLCGACNGDKSNDKAMPALWSEHGVKGKEQDRMRGLLAETQSKARALVQQLDAGAPVQTTL